METRLSFWKLTGRLNGSKETGQRLLDRLGEHPPCGACERENGAVAVGGVADQHGPGGGDFYALSAVVARVAALAPAAFHSSHIRSIRISDSDFRSASFLSVSKRVSRSEIISASSKTWPATAVST